MLNYHIMYIDGSEETIKAYGPKDVSEHIEATGKLNLLPAVVSVEA